jgi:hypothetical protein
VVLGRSSGLPKNNFLTGEQVWSIGILAGSSPVKLAASDGIRNPVLTRQHVSDCKASFVADPFMLHENGSWYMFFEAMVADTARGVISLATSPDARTWTYRGIVLEEPFHLSYPYVFKWHGEFFMVPETLRARCVRLYRAVTFPSKWVPTADLVEGEFADSSIFRHRGYWWIMACSHPYDHDQLRLFHAARLTGTWKEHPLSPIIDNNPHTARPAGRVLKWGRCPIRYAQDCLPTYGRQVHAFRVTDLTLTSYSERPAIDEPVLTPGEGWTRFGMHQIDVARNLAGTGWIACVDGLG